MDDDDNRKYRAEIVDGVVTIDPEPTPDPSDEDILVFWRDELQKMHDEEKERMENG